MKKHTLIPIYILISTLYGCSSNPSQQDQNESYLFEATESVSSNVELKLKKIEDEYIWFQKDDTIPFSGTLLTHYSNYQTETQKIYLNGKLNGLALKYHPNGLLQSEGNYIDGMKSGVWKSWYRNGQLSSKVYYLDDVKNGFDTSYFGNGQLMIVEEYEKGVINGISKAWYESGQPMVSTTYINGEEQPDGQYWYENGQPVSLEDSSMWTESSFEIMIESEE